MNYKFIKIEFIYRYHLSYIYIYNYITQINLYIFFPYNTVSKPSYPSIIPLEYNNFGLIKPF